VRIATWNVNSLKARLEKLRWWLERAAPDVLLLQETKLAAAEAPPDLFTELGYSLVHHGEGRWNGVGIASKHPIDDVLVGFGDAGPTEARMIGARTGGLRVVSLYAPNGRTVGSTFYDAKLAWFARLSRWLDDSAHPAEPLVVGGDLNVAPDDRDVWDAAACHGGTHVSPPERDAFKKLLAWGLVDAYRSKHDEAERYTWWDYRAGDFYKNFGMRIDHVLLTADVAERVVAVDIDREARKGKPIPSDHAPLVVDLDVPGRPFDPGWAGAAERIEARRAKRIEARRAKRA
jgi:exodeoxyribonuclease III